LEAVGKTWLLAEASRLHAPFLTQTFDSRGRNLSEEWFPQIKEEDVMLVLTRKRGEAIVIADNIIVTVLEVQGSRVKLGFVAPGDSPIHRAEVYEKIEQCLPAGTYAEAALA